MSVRTRRRFRSGLTCLLGAFLLSACCPSGSCGSQQQPSCSWTSEPPPNAASVCDASFATLRALVAAEVSGDDSVIWRSVESRPVAVRIGAFGARLRSRRIIFLHVVPSITLGAGANGTLGARFLIVGKTHSGTVKVPETVYLRVKHGRAKVTADQPEEEW